MPEIQFPREFADVIADLSRRVAALERSPRLPNSSVAGGSVQVLDSNGNLVGQLGALGPSYNGFQVVIPSSGLSIINASDVAGLAIPYLASPWRRPTDTVVVTSGTFVTTHDARLEILSSNAVRFVVQVNCDAGTTGQVQVLFGGWGTAGSLLGSAFTVSAASGNYEFSAYHNSQLESGPFILRLQAQRTGGTGNVTVFTPWGLAVGGAAGSGGGFPLPSGGWQTVT